MDKHTLKQYRAIVREIEQLEREKQRVLEEFLSPKPPGEPPGGAVATPDRIGNVVARRDKYQRLIDTKLDQLVALRERIETAVEGLTSGERQLMRLRYIEGLTWEKIAVELGCSYQWVCIRHGRILQKIAPLDSN